MKKLLVLLFIAVMASCSTEPQPIAYGHDSCHFCGMTIVSDAYASQAVSVKGKQFKYDAIECMVNDLNRTQEEMAVTQVSNFLAPGTMVKVAQARFVISDTLNSPMGANLAALQHEHPTAQTPDGFLEWEELKKRFQEENTHIKPH